MPLRGASKSRLSEKCKLQRCSSANGWAAYEGIARELRSATPHDLDIPSFSGRMELDKQDDHFLFDTSIQGEAYLEKQNRRDSLGKKRVRGKVKEFVQIFNQEVPEKPSFDLNGSQHQDSRRKERSKFRTEDTTNEKMHSDIVYEKNMPNASILVLC
ncbi:hypothetical protein H0E87_008080 [Populus deltoides]|uniref:Uncharacterized protein n=1 Tax=Populus deltoides TaxID=3696 RepID=A0A8T2YZD9_POPDE|nr:hypothetical protein H0E87_008080 [Populus deltoides]